MAVITVGVVHLVHAKYRSYPFEELSDPLQRRHLITELQSPVVNDLCTTPGCTRLVGHPEREWESNMHARIDGDFLSLWPTKWAGGTWEGVGPTRGWPIS